MGKSVIVYTRSGCLLCQQVIQMLTEAGIPHRANKVDDSSKQLEIIKKCGARSFPVILVGGKYIGGFTHVVHLHSQNRLRELIDEEPPVGRPSGMMQAIRDPSPSRPGASTSAMPSGAVRRTSAVEEVDRIKSEIAGFAAWGKYRKQGRGAS